MKKIDFFFEKYNKIEIDRMRKLKNNGESYSNLFII
jgi:hypothetical protein